MLYSSRKRKVLIRTEEKQMQKGFNGDFHLKGLPNRSLEVGVDNRYVSIFEGYGEEGGVWDWANRNGVFNIGN